MTTLYKAFDTVIIPFPFVDSNHSKLRPALVLSSEEFNLETKTVTCVMITSATRNAWSSDVEIKNLKQAGVKKKCYLRLKIFTVQSTLIKKMIGKLDNQEKEFFLAEFNKVFKT